MLKLDRLPYFLAVAETGSFTQAAARLGITKAVASAQIARLEEELGTTLFLRTTRRVVTTEDGAMLLGHARQILAEAGQAEEALQATREAPSGVLRLTAPLDYGQSFLMPVLAAFRQRYPACTVALDLNDEVLDLQSGKWDMALRLGWLFDSSLKSRRVGVLGQRLVVAPQLFAQITRPEHPDDLRRLPFVANSALRDPARHDFTDAQGQTIRVRLDTVATMSTTPACLAGCLAGIGAAILPDFLVSAPLAQGQLVELLPEWRLPEGGIHIVYPPQRFRPPRVIAFAAMLVEAERQRHRCTRGADPHPSD